MNINTREIIMYTRKFVFFLIANIYRSAWEHPFVLGMAFFLLLLYRFLPFLFGFLVSSSPIIICTGLLLGTLLSFGQPNIPEIEEEESTHDLSPLQIHSIGNDLVMEKDESFSIESHVEDRKRLEETAVEEVKVIEQVDHVRKSEKGALSSSSKEDEERNLETTAGICSLPKVNKKEIHIENIATDKEKINDRGHFKKAELNEAELLEDATELAELVHLATSSQTETQGLKVEIHEPAVKSHFDSSLDSSWKLIDGRDASDSDSDHAESSSPDASMADIIPMLDELHPLLDLEDPQPVNAPVDDSHSLYGASTEDGDSDDGTAEEEAENQVEGGEEEEEAKEENEDGAALAVKWTEDDEKNLIVLGTSELERNQRLENLIAKRRARTLLRLEAEKNLIDLDGNETASFMDELSRIPMQIPSISTARRNPFDLPYDSEESTGLPPVPGSAPSVLLPRQNPFDLPHDQADESGNLTGESQNHQGIFNVPPREMFFRRHESFALGASFTGELKQEKHDIKLRPYFAAERTNLEEASCAHFQRQWSEKSDSKVSSIPESESSSIAEPDFNCELSEQQVNQESAFELVSSSTNYANPVERENGFFDNVDPNNTLSRHKEIDIFNSHEDNAGTSEVCGASIHEAVNDFIKLGEQNRNDLDLCSPISDVAESDVAEEKYNGSGSSCSTEVSEKNFSTSVDERSTDLQKSSGDSSKDSSGSMRSVNGEVEVADDCHVEEPVYDSSPLAVEKSVSNIASQEEEFHHEGQGSFKSTSTLSSETLVETLEIGSRPMPAERNNFSETREFISGTGSMAGMSKSDNGALWVASSTLSSVEENESRSREVDEIREQDVIQVEFSEVNDEYDHPTASTLSESAIEQIICYSGSTETETETETETDADTDSSEDSLTDMGVNLHFSEHEKIAVAPHQDTITTSDYSNYEMSANAQSSSDSTTVQACSDDVLVDQQVDVLPSIPKDISEYVIHEEKYKIESTSGTNDELICSSIAVTSASHHNVDQEPSVLHKKHIVEIDGNDEMKKTERVPHNGDSLMFLPHIHIPDSSFDGIQVPGQVEATESLISSARAEIHEAELSDTCSTESKEEALSKLENGLPEHEHGSDAVHASLEEVKTIDDEALLLELDTIGDFHVEELKLGEGRTETLTLYGISGKKISKESSYVKSEMGGSEVLLAETRAELEENLRDLQEVEARSLEDIHMALKHVSKGTAGNQPEAMEAKCILDPQEAQAIFFEDVHTQVSEGTSESSKCLESDISHLKDVEPRPLEGIDMGSKHLSDDDHLPELIDNKNDSLKAEAAAVYIEGSPKRMGTEDKSNLVEVEARSIADIDIALKHECEGTANDLPKLTNKKDGSTEFEATERNLEPGNLEVQTSEKIGLAGAVSARESDRGGFTDGVRETHGGSSSTSSSSKRSRKEEKSESDSSSSSSSSDSD